MSRRVSLPGADELFRPTKTGPDEPADPALLQAVPASAAPTAAPPDIVDSADDLEEKRGPSGRVRHDEKITVYVTADELIDLEHTRLSLRRHGLAVDRGRLVREAIHLALEDATAHGDDSALIRRLREQ
ncbi:MAG: hypothetical protein ABJA81_10110 [Nocardioidaceae bacterium]